MIQRRYQKGPRSHYLILINRQAANYDKDAVADLLEGIRHTGGYYTTEEGESGVDLLAKAEIACGLKGRHRIPIYMKNRGDATAVVAAGGDGTTNLAARAAFAANIPVGILPMGKFNNIARSLFSDTNSSEAVKRIIKRNYCKIDTLLVGEHLVIGSFGLGFFAELARRLNGKKTPRLGLGWMSLGSKAAEAVNKKKLTIKVDSFRFDVSPKMLSVNLLPYTLGLAISPTSLNNDKHAEIIFDVGCSGRDLGSYLRQVFRKKYIYGSEIRLFRGSVMQLRPLAGCTLLIDGELVQLEDKELDVRINEKQLKLFCGE